MMSYGFEAVNDNNDVLFSDTSYTLEYFGKATYQGWAVQIGSFYYYTRNGSTLYNLPGYGLADYYVNIPPADLLAFAYIPYPGFTSILFQRASGSGTQLYAIAQNATPPTIYCFRKTQQQDFSGKWGINLYDSNGNVCFSSEANNLIPKAGANMYCPASNLVAYQVDQSYRAGNSGNEGATTISSTALLSSSKSGIVKPAISTFGTGTASIYDNLYQTFIFELGFRYNSATSKIDAQWGQVGAGQFGTRITRQIPSTTNFVTVIDGAMYD